MGIRETLSHLLSGTTLDTAHAESLFEDILAGLLDDAQIAAALSLIQVRGATFDELLAGARVMRRHVTPIPGIADLSGQIIDTCGTGGARKTFNISTLAAIITAAAAPGRVRVAKHGNRGRSGRGSAEVMAALGVNINASPELQARCLRDVGICFSFAVNHHPAMKHAAKARLSLGFPTIFNLLGPLTNPAGATRQVMGVYDMKFVEPIAHVLARLGTTRAAVLHGHDGLDEISTVVPTRIAHVREGQVHVEDFDVTSLGVARANHDALIADDLPHAVRVARDVLAGVPGPALDICLVSAAMALTVGGAAETIREGFALAKGVVHAGTPPRTLEQLVAISNQAV